MGSERQKQPVNEEAAEENNNYVTIPRGGPIYVADMVSPLTKVPYFENSVYQELQELKELICCDCLETHHEEISVDELKIIKDEELVQMALQEVHEDDAPTFDPSLVPEEQAMLGRMNNGSLSSSEHVCLERSEGETDPLSFSEPKNDLSLVACEHKPLNSDNTEKRERKRRKVFKPKNAALEESCVAKVEQLKRIKQRQEEDKAAARLHSFDGSWGTNKCAATLLEKSDRVTTIRCTSSTKVRSSNAHEHVPVQFPEVILCVEVYHNKRTPAKAQELLVLGRQFLTEVRDKICCLTDEIMRKAGLYDPSGYFLIEDVFYNDLRDASAIDYSKPILDWLENSKNEALEKWESIISGELQQKQKALLGSETKVQLPHFKATTMQNTRFCDLRFRLGAGYLYCHQGDCKHLVVIRDMRLIHPEDVQNRAAYPLTFQMKSRARKCSVCNIYRAVKVTVDDKWAQENPCYFCELCYYMLHYENGSLIYNEFSVYDCLE